MKRLNMQQKAFDPNLMPNGQHFLEQKPTNTHMGGRQLWQVQKQHTLTRYILPFILGQSLE